MSQTTNPPNAPDHGCSCGRPDCQYDKAWGNPLRETQPAPDAKPNAPEVDVLAILDREAGLIVGKSQDRIDSIRQARTAVAALLTREAALVAEVDLLRRVQASMATEGVALVAERDALAAEVGALTSARDAYRHPDPPHRHGCRRPMIERTTDGREVAVPQPSRGGFCPHSVLDPPRGDDDQRYARCAKCGKRFLVALTA